MQRELVGRNRHWISTKSKLDTPGGAEGGNLRTPTAAQRTRALIWGAYPVRLRSPASGRLAQLARALPSHGRGRWFESSIAHHESTTRDGHRVSPSFMCRQQTALRATFIRTIPHLALKAHEQVSRSQRVRRFSLLVHALSLKTILRHGHLHSVVDIHTARAL